MPRPQWSRSRDFWSLVISPVDGCNACRQGLNHVFKVGGPIPLSRVLLPFYRKNLERSTQFGAVGYIITLYSSKSYFKSWGSVQILGRSGPLVAATMYVGPTIASIDISIIIVKPEWFLIKRFATIATGWFWLKWTMQSANVGSRPIATFNRQYCNGADYCRDSLLGRLDKLRVI